MPATVLDRIRSRARELRRRIVLTESDDVRNLQAAAKLAATGRAVPVLVGDGAAIRRLAAEAKVGLDGVEVVDVPTCPRFEAYVAAVVERRRHKGLTPEQARTWILDTCVFAAAMVTAGDAHGYVSGGGNPKGYNHDTASKTRPALQLFGTAPGIRTASAYFIMQLADPRWGYNGALFYADCGLNINPNVQQLAEIAVTTGRTFHTLTGDEPRIGMISCSTKGSAKDPSIDKVIAATARARSLAPDLLIDGEFQFDAAVIPDIAATLQRAHFPGLELRQHDLQGHRAPRRRGGHRPPGPGAQAPVQRCLARLLGGRHRRLLRHGRHHRVDGVGRGAFDATAPPPRAAGRTEA